MLMLLPDQCAGAGAGLTEFLNKTAVKLVYQLTLPFTDDFFVVCNAVW